MTLRTTLLLASVALAAAGCTTASVPAPETSVSRVVSPAPAPQGVDTPAAEAVPPASARIIVPIPANLGLPPDAQAALQTLANAEAFGGEAVGFAGKPVPAVVALRQVVKLPSAAKVLQLVLAHGTMAAQLLALSGLYGVDHAAFVVAVQPYRDVSTAVKVNRGGCFQIIDDVPVRDLVEATGAMQRARPDESLGEWVRRNPGSKNLVLDLMGGGYSLVIVGA